MLDVHECAQCAIRQDAPKDWVVEISQPNYCGVMYVPMDALDEVRDPQNRYRELCGQACATRSYSAWFDSWLHPQNRDPLRASTLVLQPPLRRNGLAPWPPPPDESEAS